ncbi:MAG: hypothetical protein AAFX51_16255, partial [Cyanobacteria bacterium J06636_28]
MAVDVLILTNGPGEVSTWVKPVVQQLRKREPDHGQLRLSVMLSPCPQVRITSSCWVGSSTTMGT